MLKMRYRCLHKTGGVLNYKPEKCVRIIEACLKLHNKAIKERIPLQDIEGAVDLFDQQDQLNENANDRNGIQIRHDLIQRFA